MASVLSRREDAMVIGAYAASKGFVMATVSATLRHNVYEKSQGYHGLCCYLVPTCGCTEQHHRGPAI